MFITGIHSETTLFRTTAGFPPSGVCRQSNAEILDLSVDDLKISSVLLQGPDTPVEHQLGFRSPHGSMHYSRKSNEPASWKFSSASRGRWTLPAREKQAWDLASPILATLADLCERLPDHHLPHLDHVTPEEQELIRTELSAQGEARWPAPGRFDRGLLLMTETIARARETDRGLREEAERRKRLRKQFNLLPEGTVLVSRRWVDRVAVVSNQRGQRTKRTLMERYVNSPAKTVQTDSDHYAIEGYALVTPERAGKARRVLSAHETLEAIKQAQTLAPLCPDFA